MSRCMSCNALIEYEYNYSNDLCWVCTAVVRKTVSDKDHTIPKDRMLTYARTGVTPARGASYES